MKRARPFIAAAPDDVEAELARLSASLGIAGGELAGRKRLFDDAAAQITGYSLHDDGSVSLHFATATALTDLLAGSIALRVVDDITLPAPVQLVAPESTR